MSDTGGRADAAVLSQSVEPKCAPDPPCRDGPGAAQRAVVAARYAKSTLTKNLTALNVGKPCECA